ncbi:hypothetical protein [Nocardia brasiliensis]|uniref:hypothetical protein n=1 Tax=Nocardia brasiliensis TaxID=37326 RepID=UPI00189478A1|nr:hypothetical protein [Nocardia brasiliensis]MBF6548852.1 hypothetical protein [Nocardia brasiliensis]
MEPRAYTSGGPLIPHRTDLDDDHDPVCGHLLIDHCDGCSSCTRCDICWCAAAEDEYLDLAS